ncbi:MAG: hypothetical protein JWR22_2475 [Herminiimonas sp.]|nr:hypothetical protein [Herminiimonas sp.]
MNPSVNTSLPPASAATGNAGQRIAPSSHTVPIAAPTLQNRLATSSHPGDEDDFLKTPDFYAHLLQSLESKLMSLRPPLAPRVADIAEVFRALDEARHALSAILKTNSNVVDLLHLQTGLSIFLHYLDEALHSPDPDMRLDPVSLSLPQIRTICRGLAACAPSTGTLLWQSMDLRRDRTCLQGLTSTLLFRAMMRGLLTDVRANRLLLDILYWVSCGLEKGLLGPSDAITRCFEISLVLIEEWTGEDTCRQLVVDQNLGRCAAMLRTIARYNAMDLDAVALPGLSDCREKTNGRRLQRCVLNLCAKEVLEPPSASAIDVPAVLHICGTIKDMLDRSLLPASHPAVLKKIERLLKHIGNLPDHELIGRHRDCAPLSSFSNFLRALAHHRVDHRLVFRDALPMQDFACARIISCISGDMFGKAGLNSRTLAELLGFVQFRDQRHAYKSARLTSPDTTAGTTLSTTATATVPLGYAALEAATTRLMANLIEKGADYFNTTRAVGELLARLAYLSENIFLHASWSNRRFIAALVANIGEIRPEAWGENAKAAVLDALESLQKMRIVTFDDVLPALVYLLPQSASNSGERTTKELAQEFYKLSVVEAALKEAMDAAASKSVRDTREETGEDTAEDHLQGAAETLQAWTSFPDGPMPVWLAASRALGRRFSTPVISVIKRQAESNTPTPERTTSLTTTRSDTTNPPRTPSGGIAITSATDTGPRGASIVGREQLSTLPSAAHVGDFAGHPPQFSGLDALLVEAGLAPAMPDSKST